MVGYIAVFEMIWVHLYSDHGAWAGAASSLQSLHPPALCLRLKASVVSSVLCVRYQTGYYSGTNIIIFLQDCIFDSICFCDSRCVCSIEYDLSVSRLDVALHKPPSWERKWCVARRSIPRCNTPPWFQFHFFLRRPEHRLPPPPDHRSTGNWIPNPRVIPPPPPQKTWRIHFGNNKAELPSVFHSLYWRVWLKTCPRSSAS